MDNQNTNVENNGVGESPQASQSMRQSDSGTSMSAQGVSPTAIPGISNDAAQPQYVSSSTQPTTQIEKQKYNSLAVVALIFAFIFMPLSLILGIVSLRQIKRTGEKGAVLAWIAIIIDVLFISIGIFLFFFGF